VGPGAGGAGAAPSDAGCIPDVSLPEMVVQGCFESGFCPQADDPSARQQLNGVVHTCDTTQYACCLENVIDQIVCGPSMSGGNCCYVVLVSIHKCG
jgi:hypothetical protein